MFKINCLMDSRLAVSKTTFSWAAAAMCALPLLVSCDPGGNSMETSSHALIESERDVSKWHKVINECISKVEQSDAAFYRGRQRVTGKELAREMRKSLSIVLRHKSLPDPFGWNVGVLLAVLTTHEGYAMDGITGRPRPFEVEVQQGRMTVYDWLKEQLDLGSLPGEEDGHQVVPPLYDAVLSAELLKQWEQYLDRCVDVTRQARDCRFLLAGKWFQPVEAAGLFASNRVAALATLKQPNIKNVEEKEDYDASNVLITLTSVPLPLPEQFADSTEYGKALERHIFSSLKELVDRNGTQINLFDWLLREAGEPPPMPELRKKRKDNR